MARAKVFDKISGSWIYADKSFGKDGKTPVKGVDYFDGKDYVLTDADKKEIAELAADLVEVPESSDGVQDVFIGTSGTHYNEYLRHFEEGKICFLKQPIGNLLLTQKATAGSLAGTLIFEGYSGGSLKQYQLSPENRWTFINNSFTREISESSTNAEIPSAKAVYDAMQNMGGSGGNVDFVVQDTPPEDTSVLWVDPTDDTEDGSTGIAVTGAKVGQTVKIAEVDENGVPTAWESVDFPCEEEYELIETITIEQSVTTLGVSKYPDGGDYNLKKAIAILSFPKMNEEYTTGSMEVNFTVGGKRAYGAFGSSMTIPVHDTRIFQLSAEAVINGGLIAGRNNMSMTSQLEHSARNNGPIISKVGENKISHISAYVQNGIPAGTTIEIYGVRA